MRADQLGGPNRFEQLDSRHGRVLDRDALAPHARKRRDLNAPAVGLAFVAPRVCRTASIVRIHLTPYTRASHASAFGDMESARPGSAINAEGRKEPTGS